MLLQNYCDTGSMVRRALLDAGLRFDESLSVGFEDWDFWLQAAGRGFSGQHLPRAGFRYRIRPESRNQMAERQRPALIAALYRKHAALLRPRALLALEAAEMPRYAVHVTDRATLRFLLDPATEDAPDHSRDAARQRLAEWLEAPTARHFPATCCFAEAAALALLRRLGILHAVFWWAERLLRDHPVVAVAIEPAAGPELVIEPGGDAAGRVATAPLLFAATRTLAESAASAMAGWAESLLGDRPRLRIGLLRLRLEGEAAPAGPVTPAGQLVAEIAALGTVLRQRSPLAAEWRGDYRQPRGGVAAALRAAVGLGLTLPRLPAPGQRDIAFLLPLFSFAGLEKVVLNQAAVLRRHGWRTHLVVAGTLRIDRPPGFAEAFDSVTLFAGLGESWLDWNGGYFGAAQSKLAEHGEAADALALLAGFDVVVNVHSLGCQALMAALRELGLRTFGGLHLVERGPWGEPEGTFFVQAAYENAYDGVVVISDQLRDWCIAHGLPAGKVQVVRNAPGYPAAPERIAAALAARAAQASRPLQVLFLGRLDAQKGLDRLATLIERSRGDGLAWRVIGRAVLDGAAAPALGVPIEPPAFTPEDLDAAYAWADVLVVPSRFEGVPLVVLEAQRMGCAVIATDVGAMAEIIRHGEDGFLIPHDQPEAAIVAGFAAVLARLAEDRAELLAVGAGAAGRLARSGWPDTMRGFIDHLDALVPPTRLPGMPS